MPRATRARRRRRGAAAARCARMPARTLSGYLTITSVSNVPAATAVTATPSAAQRAASSRVSASTVARAAPECAMPGMPWWGDSVTLTIVAGAGVAEAQLECRLGHVQHPFYVQSPHRPPALRRDQLGRAEELTTGVVDEHIQPPLALRARPRSATAHRRSRARRRPAHPPAPRSPPRSRRRPARARRPGVLRSSRPRRSARARARSRARGRCRHR